MEFLKADLLKGNILRSLLVFAIPLMLANFFQQLYNTADTVIVGHFLGDDSLAAMGATSPVYELLVGFALGVGNGMSIVAARFFGMGDRERLKQAVAGSLVIGLLLSIAIMLIARLGLYRILQLLDTPADIMDEAYSYIGAVTMFVGVMFIYNLAAGMLRAVGNSVTPLLFLIFSSFLNIILDILFVGYTGMGILGAAVATVISQGVSAVLCIIFLLKKCRRLIPSGRHFRVEGWLYKELAGQGFSMGFMLCIVSLGTVILQYSVNGFGKLLIAGHTAARKLDYFCMMPLNTMGLAFSTFVSQNYGAGNKERIRSGIKAVNLLALGYSVFITVIIWMTAPVLIKLISGSSETDVINNGALYIRMNVPFYPIVGIVFNLRNSLQGLGRKLVPLVASVLECLGKIIFVIVMNPFMGYWGVIICEPSIWIVMAAQLIFAISYDPYMSKSEKGQLGAGIKSVSKQNEK